MVLSGASECHSVSLLPVKQGLPFLMDWVKGATVVAALWGIYVWKRIFKEAKGVKVILKQYAGLLYYRPCHDHSVSLRMEKIILIII